jgi:hypothetical protein
MCPQYGTYKGHDIVDLYKKKNKNKCKIWSMKALALDPLENINELE